MVSWLDEGGAWEVWLEILFCVLFLEVCVWNGAVAMVAKGFVFMEEEEERRAGDGGMGFARWDAVGVWGSVEFDDAVGALGSGGPRNEK